MRIPVAGLLFPLSLLVTGCGFTDTAKPTSDAGAVIQGMVHGGQQPIVGARVYLLAANTTGYGGLGIAASSSNASVSLLNPVITGLSDSVGAYVLTGAGGSFSITADYACTPNTQVYLYALGGNPGAGTNTASGLMAVLGNCPATATFAATTPFVIVNEVSTVAAAYAIAGFATDATHVSSSGTTLARTGIANAFLAASNLASLAGGNALPITPGGNGTVPQSEINTLANILASCINSTGSASSSCTTLLGTALSGGTTGSLPTDTASAAINIAHNPGVNVSTLYGLATAAPPFSPALAKVPAAFTIGITYTGGGMTLYMENMAIDGSGNIWLTDSYSTGFSNGNAISEFSPLGAALSPASGYTGGGLSAPIGIAVAPSGNIYVSNGAGNSVSVFSASGLALSPSSGYTFPGLDYPSGIAFDNLSNLWVTNYSNSTVSKFTTTGTPALIATLSGSGIQYPQYVAVDASNNIWIANEIYYEGTGSALSEFTNAGAALSGTAGYTGGGLDLPNHLAIDAQGAVWAANQVGTSVSKLSSSGAAVSPSTGFTAGLPVVTGTPSDAFGIAIDGAGNVWTSDQVSGQTGLFAEFSNTGASLSPAAGYLMPNFASTYNLAVDGSGNLWLSGVVANLTEFIGIAAPVVTPLVAGVQNKMLGTRP